MDKPLPDTTSEGTTQSDTPETDAKELWGKYVMADFARSLERRLRAAEAEQRKIFSAEQAQIEAPLLARIKELEERLWRDGFDVGRADTLAKVVAWMEREADEYGYACQYLIEQLRDHPEIIDQPAQGER